MRKKLVINLALIVMLFSVSLCNGCGSDQIETEAESSDEASSAISYEEKYEEKYDKEAVAASSLSSDIKIDEVKNETMTFVDVFGEEYQTEILRDVPGTDIDKKLYIHEDEKLFYQDEKYTSRLGVDVSHHQGHIDWDKVKAAGYDFAFIRLGYRGYGQAGNINLDKRFNENIKNAKAAGLEVGVYFFAQAINEEEAKEEAEFVIKHLEEYELELPVVYDPESILDAKARTDDVSGEQFTKNTQVFCSLVEAAGYEPTVYSNMLWEAFEFDMSQVSKYNFWYADYEKEPQTPYRYKYWQYTNIGRVDGISGNVDLNIELIER